MVDRIAADGYVVLAPNVFYRAGRFPVLPLPDLTDPEQRTSFFQVVRPLIEQLTAQRIAGDGAVYQTSAPSAGRSRSARSGPQLPPRLVG
jgi:carboxymethylenebutenolidase